MKCPACGARLPKGATFCPTCYTPTGAPTATTAAAPTATATTATTGAIPTTAVPRLIARPRRRGRVVALAVATLGVVAVAIVGALTLTRRAAAPQAIPPIGTFAYADLVPSGLTFQSLSQPREQTLAGRSLASYEYRFRLNGLTYYKYTVTVWGSAAAAQAADANMKSYASFIAGPSAQVWRPLPTGEWMVIKQSEGVGAVYATTSSNTVSMSFQTGDLGVGAGNIPTVRTDAVTIMQRVRQATTTH